VRDDRAILIDPPSPFAPRKEWVAFLAEMEDVLRDNPGWRVVEDAIADAKAEISRTVAPGA
jgi:hypothetical protein